MRLFQNSGFIKENFDVWDINLSPEMHAITIPTLIIWGTDDMILPFVLAQDAYNAIGTPKKDKKIIKLEKTTHNVSSNVRELLFKSMIKFIETYKTNKT